MSAIRSAVLCVLLGLALALPSLAAGFVLDDYLQIAHLEGWSLTETSPLDLFTFLPRDPASGERLRADGVMPYFTAPDLSIVFVRPLSSALIWLDHAAFGRQPLLYHLHSLLWYAALLIAAALLFRRALAPPLATLALLLFCIDDGHAMTVSFLAARNGAVATTLVLFALLAHQRWRADGWRPGALIAPALAACGLAAGEMALGALAYLLAWEIAGRRPGWKKALAPTAVLGMVYLIIYKAAGAGAHDSGAYLDPFGDPAGFLRALPERMLILVGGLVLSTPVDFLPLDGRLRAPFAVAGLVSAVVLVVWLPRALRRMSRDEARAVAWMGLGAAGSLLVGTPALPGDRVLLAASVGGAAVVAALLRDAWRLFRGAASAVRARLGGALGLLLIGLPNLALSVVALPGKIALFDMVFADDRRLAREAEIEAPVPARVVILAADDLLGVQLPAVRAVELGRTAGELRALVRRARAGAPDLPLPDRFGYLGTTVLSLATGRHRVRRTAADELELSTPDGTLFDGIWVEALRRPTLPLPRGTVVRTKFMTATVLDDRGGQPTRVAFRFDRPLEDPSLVFLWPARGGLRRFVWPPVGAEQELPPFSAQRFRQERQTPGR